MGDDKKIKKFMVERKTWNRGIDHGSLYNDYGKCCLGFLALACGYTEREIRLEGDPSELMNDANDRANRWPDGLVVHVPDTDDLDDGDPDNNSHWANTPLCDDIINTNDSATTSDAEREQHLVELFGKIGIEVEFVDEVAGAE